MHIITKLLTTYGKEKTSWATRAKGQGNKAKSANRIFTGNNVSKMTVEQYRYSTEIKNTDIDFFTQWYLLHCEIKILSDLKEPKKIHYQQTCTTRNVKGSSSSRRKIILDIILDQCKK